MILLYYREMNYTFDLKIKWQNSIMHDSGYKCENKKIIMIFLYYLYTDNNITLLLYTSINGKFSLVSSLLSVDGAAVRIDDQ